MAPPDPAAQVASPLVDLGAQGLYARSFEFEAIVRGVEALVSAAGDVPATHRYFFPPVTARATLVASGYLASFPDLVGSVSTFTGGDAELGELARRVEAGDDWEGLLTPVDIALCSSACHPLYGIVARAPLSAAGEVFEVQGICFRHEPSAHLERMQSFRQHEFVFVGPPDGARAHRDGWMDRATTLLRDLGLDVAAEAATDPFFGRAGRLLASGQRDRQLKFELVAPVPDGRTAAIASVNLHEDHFGEAFGIFLDDGARAHSACIGFGLDRIALALLAAHGPDPARWAPEVRTSLSLTDGPPR